MIEPAGKMIGMSCYYGKDMAIISITTIHMCIKMWTSAGSVSLFLLLPYPFSSLDELFPTYTIEHDSKIETWDMFHLRNIK